ncbi:phosphotriesterase [Alicyclobacillus acidoterrestris]|nr:phosphotriesterase [Alicyclobacillus acidoterrestris]
MSFVRTVLGDISPIDLGKTLTHEHIIASPPKKFADKDPDLVLDSVEKIIAEVGDFQKTGGKSIVDATAIDYGRNIEAVVQVAHATGVNLIATAGFNKGLFFDQWIYDASQNELTERVIREVEEGIDGTSHKAGQVKFGTMYQSIWPVEEKVLKAVAEAQKETGAPMFSHTEAGTMALEQIELVERQGVSLEHWTVGHLDRNPDLWYHLQVAKKGVYLSFDQLSKIKYHTDQIRMDVLIELIKRGYQKKILLSGDMARKSYLTQYGGGPGFTYIPTRFVPRLVDELGNHGFSDEKIDQIVEDLTVNNPREFLTFKK